ncbi:MAG TPA: hypothetical protein VFS50_14455 [Meiothermus sp.]|jgi:hypothetical protein|nr:hypothetical protein [Meiothermus sp.]
MAERDAQRSTEAPNPQNLDRDSSPDDFERENPPLPTRGTVGEVNESLEDTYPMTSPKGDPQEVDLNLDPMQPEDEDQDPVGRNPDEEA